MAGGLKPLQTISIAAAFLFIFIMIAMMFAVIKALQADKDTPNVGDPDFVPDPDVAAMEAAADQS
jgi:glycine betaine transporter